MSFAQSFDHAHSIQSAIQLHKTDGNSGEMSSPVRDGAEAPGTSTAHPISELVPRRTKIHTRTGKLERKYASTGTNRGKEAGHKDYGAGEIGQKNLRGR